MEIARFSDGTMVSMEITRPNLNLGTRLTGFNKLRRVHMRDFTENGKVKLQFQ